MIRFENINKIILLLIFLYVNYLYTNQYEKYISLADPLFSPWLSDPIFLQIDQEYPEPHYQNAFRDGRYYEYSFARAALACKTGDYIECGVFTGKSLDIFAGVLDLFDVSGRRLFGFDSFEGLDSPGIEDIDVRTNAPFFAKGSIRGLELEEIKQMLAQRKCNIELIKGWIPLSFQGYEDLKFAFAHIDVDLYEATKDCLIFIYPRMVPWGIILFDDYGFPMCKGARKAVDEFLADKPECIISMPSGQAFLIKTGF